MLSQIEFSGRFGFAPKTENLNGVIVAVGTSTEIELTCSYNIKIDITFGDMIVHSPDIQSSSSHQYQSGNLDQASRKKFISEFQIFTFDRKTFLDAKIGIQLTDIHRFKL